MLTMTLGKSTSLGLSVPSCEMGMIEIAPVS